MIKKLTVNQAKLYFGAHDHPFVELHTSQGTLKAMVDTGFSMGLVLPSRWKSFLQTTTNLPTNLVLGNGEVISTTSYLLELEREKTNLGVVSAFTFDAQEALVGVEFLHLWGKKLLLDWQRLRGEFLA